MTKSTLLVGLLVAVALPGCAMIDDLATAAHEEWTARHPVHKDYPVDGRSALEVWCAEPAHRAEPRCLSGDE